MLKRVVLICLGLVVAIFALAIIFGGPQTPHPMGSINDPFDSVDFSDLPPLSGFAARDGTKLAYRSYPSVATTAREGSVVLIHGSSATSSSMHPMAKALSAAGYRVYALDVRGHGASGRKGQIAYIGQLEDDLTDFMQAVSPPAPVTLAGFSSGGGFALRFAGGSQQNLFQNYLLLAPFLSPDAPTVRPGSGGWASVGLPRIIAIAALNGFGIRTFNSLPVLRFAVSENTKAILTPEYSYALTMNFGPQRDYLANIRSMHRPFRVLVGANDEVYYPDRFVEVLKRAGKDTPVTMVPGVGHVQLLLAPVAFEELIEVLKSLRSRQ
ncbi:MAG TPA: alpha/beta hydrolase [Candidatus Udaeobacter sp.]|nr:alpha/beta hydrolase [Candidatus Udaeobacter sp.]